MASSLVAAAATAAAAAATEPGASTIATAAAGDVAESTVEVDVVAAAPSWQGPRYRPATAPTAQRPEATVPELPAA